MVEQRRGDESGRGQASRPVPGRDAYADALGYAEAIIATVREPLVVLEADLRVRTANRSFYRTFRVSAEQTEGRSLFDLGDGQWDIPALRKLLGEVLPQDTAFADFEVEHDFPDIGKKVMLLNARKVYREGNHTELILLAIEDVTALREAERARREAEARFTEMVKNVRDHSIFLTDPEGVITSWNVAAERIIGYSEAEAVGRHFSLIFTPEDVGDGVPERELRQARERGRAEDERWHRKKDGTKFWALGIVTPLHDPDGRLSGFSKILRDMTAWKRAEEELAAGRRRLQAVFDTSLDAILLADDQARFVDANPAACDLLGQGREELLHRGVFDITPPPNGEAGRAAWAAFVRDGQQSGEYEVRGKDGTTAVVEYRAVANVQPGLHLSVLRDVSERKRTEQALRESREQLRAIIDNWPSVIFVKDPEGRYLLANKACEAYAGEPVERIVGKTDYDYMPAEVADRFRTDDLRVLQAGEALRYEEVAPRGGEERTSLTVKFPLRDASGQPYAVCGIATDVTDLKRAGEALQVSEERFARFMQHLPGLAWIKDAQGKYVYANEAAVNAFGKSRAELYGKTDEDVFPPTTAARFRENDRKALAGGSGVRVVETLEQADGVLHHSVVSKFPIPIPDGGAALVGGMAIDITEEMRTRAILEESEERLRATFEQAAVGIAHVGIDGRWQRVNQKLCDIAGYGGDELLGLTFQDITHPDDLEADLAQIRRLLAGEIETYSMEKRYFRKDGSLVWIDLTVSLVRTPQGEPKYFISVVEDITEKKRVQEALRESEAKYRTLFENMAEEVHFWQVVRDEHGRIQTWRLVDANPPTLKTWGKTLEKIRGKTTDEIFGPGATDHYLPVVQKIMSEGIPHSFEDYFPNLGKHFRFTSVPLGDHFITTGADITGIKKAQDTLRQSEARYRTVLESITDAFFALGRDWRFTYVNRQAERVLGRTPGDLLGKSLWDEFPGLAGSEFERAYRRVMAERVSESVTAYYPDHDRWYEVHVYPAEGGISVYFRDVSDRVRADEALRAGEERYRTLFESMDEGYCVIEMIFDPPDGGRAVDYRFLEVNPAFEAQAGMKDATGRRMLEFVPSIEDHWLANYGRVALTGEPVRFANEYTGLNRWFEVYAFRVGGEGSRRVGVLFTDITLRKQAEDDRERLVGQLRDADRRKDEFLATLAHELRNPLAPLRNGLQVMRLATGDAAAVEQARSMMERQMAVMVRLIDDLLDVSRITRGKLELRKERVELAGVVHSAVEGSRPVIEASGHRLTISLPAEPVHLEADPTRLAQVFGNLLTNAAKYTERGGQITLSARREGGEAVVSVRDTGIGIAPEHLPHVFEMFSQVDSALDRSQGGLGIGLSLVRGLVEMHGGSVEARSEGPGKGSEFVVRLPVAGDRSAPQSPQTGGGENDAARPRRRILVADDNRDAADSLAMMLRLAGHEVHAVYDGREAVEAAAWFRPDLALLDIGMPKLNGMQAARHIREQQWGMNVVLVAITGWGQEEDKRRAMEAGFNHHLTKPVDPAALETLLVDLAMRGGSSG